jgi:lipopolysaccharide export system protein LptC
MMDATVENGAGGYRSGGIERTERGEEAFAHARRHSRRVRALKLVLPVAAVLMVAVFVGYSMLADAVKRVSDLASLSIDDGGVVMANPKLEGFTKDDLPYSLHAEEARQPLNGEGTIVLKGISASIPIDKENRAKITATSGTFNRDENVLDIDSDIVLDATSGLKARLQSAYIDIAENTLTTDDPVDIQVNGMHIAANGMNAANGGKSLVFEDGVKVRIDPSALDAGKGNGGGKTQ